VPHTTFRIRAAQCCLVVAMSCAAASIHGGEPPTSWSFSAYLDDKPIGSHRFDLTAAAGEVRELHSEARFEVKFLGFTAYRYHHLNRERWAGNCLGSLAANTDDDGKTTAVNGEATDRGFAVSTRAGKKSSQVTAQGCVLSFAYWNPTHLATQRQLLDPGTGRIEPVTITRLAASSVPVRGATTAVTGLRIAGLKHPIDVWYDSAGHWVGLDTSVEGNRRLTYRLP
jgi:hypothetical protein